MNKTIAKRKTSMVLYTIEESLGNYVLENENSISLDGSISHDFKIKDSLEKSYLDDIFQLVIKATKDTTEEEAIKRLYKLAHELNLFEIRNAIAHPNRAFLDVYWYRVAAIAADPVFECIGIKNIKAVLYSAEEGTIEEPPEGWESKYTWNIPNNLPVKFESDITGLIGRNKELTDLKEKLMSARTSTAAIVAPGGYGKTAVVLDLLKDIVTTAESTKWVDAVSYITLKTETWKNGEFVKLDASSEMIEVEKQIAEQLGVIFDEYIDDIEQAITELADKRIIICIDNLETILRDNDELFHNFVDRLPRDWKIVVTSRISITNAYIYTLKELKEKPAIHLARLYNKNRGGDELLQEKYTQLAKDCHLNPLAIKMTLDLYLSGKEIPTSINEAKSNIANFSFSNLIESLSTNAIKILELIFIESKSSRKLICDILEINTDEAASVINELSRTSLINRSSNETNESYEINGSIKDLLIINPKCLEIRTEIQNKLNRQVTLANEIDIKQKASNLPEWHFQYIPPNIDHGLKLLMNNFSKLRFSKNNTRNERLSEVYSSFKEKEEHYKENYLFLRSYAKLLETMQLKRLAENYYIKATTFSNDMVSNYLLARFYFDQNNFEKSLFLYKKLVEVMEYIEKDSSLIPFYDTIYQGFFLSHLYDGDYQSVLDYTKKWQEENVFRALFGTYRASAYKRRVEAIINTEFDETINSLNSATKILDDVFRTDGYSQASCGQGYKIIEEVYYCLRKNHYVKAYESECLQLLNFCDKHLINIVDTSRSKDANDIKFIVSAFIEITIKGNPFILNRHWKSYSQSSFNDAIDVNEISGDHTLVHVKHVASNPKGGKTNFLFAECINHKEYFVHFNAIKNCDWSDWLKISEDTELAITECEIVKGKTALNVIASYLVNT
ncbi:NB-ARC domain-containing protein [Pseudoalteromonas sp. 2CM28B]|uniref:NB-ARC domain-containing protein n=1 Tax=Pseudoalteromonas sp. 2CM28B TaxID=2929851 RepID=UPI0020BDAB97|nr:NB-ARC domain-containing protein [Pseudoalteromonas sp. 2CM28B]MCK8131539.1 hypothetical protein [Pseudoalteromonas sp. 2CM28B]